MPTIAEEAKRAAKQEVGDLVIEVIGKTIRVYEVASTTRLKQIAYSDTLQGQRFLMFSAPSKEIKPAKDFTIARLYKKPEKARKIIGSYFPKYAASGASAHLYYSGQGPRGRIGGIGEGYFTVKLGMGIGESIEDRRRPHVFKVGDKVRAIGGSMTGAVLRVRKGGDRSMPTSTQKLTIQWHGKDRSKSIKNNQQVELVQESIEEAKAKKFDPAHYDGPTYKVGDRVKIVRRFGWKPKYRPTPIKPPVSGKVKQVRKHALYSKGPPVLVLTINPKDFDRATPGVVHTATDEIWVHADEVESMKKSEPIDERFDPKAAQDYVKGITDRHRRAYAREYLKALRGARLPPQAADYKLTTQAAKEVEAGFKRLGAPIAASIQRNDPTFEQVARIVSRAKGAGFSPNRITLNERFDSAGVPDLRRQFVKRPKKSPVSTKDYIFIVHDDEKDTYSVGLSVHDNPRLGYQELQTGLSLRAANRFERKMKARWKAAQVRRFLKVGHGHERKWLPESDEEKTKRIKDAVDLEVKDPKKKGLTIAQTLLAMFGRDVDEAKAPRTRGGQRLISPSKAHRVLKQKQQELKAAIKRGDEKEASLLRALIQATGKMAGINYDQYIEEGALDEAQPTPNEIKGAMLALVKKLRRMRWEEMSAKEAEGFAKKFIKGKLPGLSTKQIGLVSDMALRIFVGESTDEADIRTKVLNYIGRIKDKAKKAYAEAYFTWLTSGQIGHPPRERDFNLGVAGAKAVRARFTAFDFGESTDETRRKVFVKKEKEEVNYRKSQEDTDGDERCGDCAFIDMPDACQRVAGKISQDFTCDLWKKGVQEDLDEVYRQAHHGSLGKKWVKFVESKGWDSDTDFMAASALAGVLYMKHDVSYATHANVQSVRETAKGLSVTTKPTGAGTIKVSIPKSAYAAGASHDKFMRGLITGKSEDLDEAGAAGKVQAALLDFVKKLPADSEYTLADVMRRPALRGVHFKRLMSAAKSLAKKGLVWYDGMSNIGPVRA